MSKMERDTRVEECKNNWSDGTCPQCGETHYVTVRRSVLAQAEREREEARLFGERQAAKVIDLRAEVERLRAVANVAEQLLRERDRAKADLTRVRAALERLINAWALALSEVGTHEGHHTQTDPDTMCLDCWELREARAALEGR